VDGEPLRFGATLRGRVCITQARASLAAWRLGFFEGTGADLRSGLESLEPQDLVLELLDEFDEKGNKFKELPHQRCLFGHRDFRNSDLHTSILRRPVRRAAAQPTKL
jgi:hypothetical protein